MLRDKRLFEPHVTRCGTTSSVHFTIQCSKCPAIFTVNGPRVLPDEAVAKKAKRKHWLISRTGHHLCPDCLGVKPENKLAAVFPTRKDGVPVPPADAIVAEAEKMSPKMDPRTAAALNRLIPPKPCEATPSGRQGSGDEPPISPDAKAICGRIERVIDINGSRASVLVDQNALLERIVRQNDELIRLNEIRNRELNQQNRYFEQHLLMWEAHMESWNRQLALQEQMIRAVANIAPVIARSSESLSCGLREAMTTVAEAAAALDPEPQKSAPEGNVVQMPVRPARPAPEPEPAALPKPKKKTTQRKSRAAVASCPHKESKTGYYTGISVERKVWNEAGFGPDDKVDIALVNHKLVIRKALTGGLKPKKVGPYTVALQTTRLGDLNFERFHIDVEPGCLKL